MVIIKISNQILCWWLFWNFNSNSDSNSGGFNSNSNSNSAVFGGFQFRFQFQFQEFQFQFQFQFRLLGHISIPIPIPKFVLIQKFWFVTHVIYRRMIVALIVAVLRKSIISICKRHKWLCESVTLWVSESGSQWLRESVTLFAWNSKLEVGSTSFLIQMSSTRLGVH